MYREEINEIIRDRELKKELSLVKNRLKYLTKSCPRVYIPQLTNTNIDMSEEFKDIIKDYSDNFTKTKVKKSYSKKINNILGIKVNLNKSHIKEIEEIEHHKSQFSYMEEDLNSMIKDIQEDDPRQELLSKWREWTDVYNASWLESEKSFLESSLEKLKQGSLTIDILNLKLSVDTLVTLDEVITGEDLTGFFLEIREKPEVTLWVDIDISLRLRVKDLPENYLYKDFKLQVSRNITVTKKDLGEGKYLQSYIKSLSSKKFEKLNKLIVTEGSASTVESMLMYSLEFIKSAYRSLDWTIQEDHGNFSPIRDYYENLYDEDDEYEE